MQLLLTKDECGEFHNTKKLMVILFEMDMKKMPGH